MSDEYLKDICPMCNGSGYVENDLFCPVCEYPMGYIKYRSGMIVNGQDRAYIEQQERQTATAITLEITSFVGYSVGAQHVYGTLKSDWFSIDVRQNISEREAAEVNKYLRREYDDLAYRLYKVEPGTVQRGFLEAKDVVEQARKIARLVFPKAEMMTIVDRHSDLSGQEILI